MNGSFMELKKSYNSFELKSSRLTSLDGPVNTQGKSFLDTIYSDEKIPFSSAARKGENRFKGARGTFPLSPNFSKTFIIGIGSECDIHIVKLSLQLWPQSNHKDRVLDEMPCDSKDNYYSWRQLRICRGSF